MPESDRDPLVAERYREIAREAPPHSLDAAIVSAARDALEVRPAPLVAPTARRRWFVPLAAAAVIVLSVAVTLHLQREQPDLEFAPIDAPGAVARPQAPQVERVAPAAAPRADDAQRARVQTPQAPRPETALAAGAKTSAAAPVPEPRRAPQAGTGDLAHRSSAELSAKPAAEPSSPEAWLERIAQLRREGRHADADEAYAAFRRRYPDFRVPEALRDQVLPR